MGEIKVGDFVRTKSGFIRKVVTEKYKNCFLVDRRYYNEAIDDYTLGIIPNEDILKHSPNIIDLLEVKDVIKYQELRSLTNKYGTSFYEYYICDIHTEEELEQIKNEIKSHAIKLISVLTKELFKNSEYEVK